MNFDTIRVEGNESLFMPIKSPVWVVGKAFRDPGLCEANYLRPQTGYYVTLIDEGAALWESLSQNHPFIDGYKRTVTAEAFVFLAINGLEIVATDAESQDFILGLLALR